jgi:hypothetical protein
MKKMILFAIAALFIFSGYAFAENCVDCTGKTNNCDDAYWACPGDQGTTCNFVDDFCPVIFKVCDCEDADAFKGGAEIAFRWTTQTEGAYFINSWNGGMALYADYVAGYWHNTIDDTPTCVEREQSLDYFDVNEADANAFINNGGYYKWTDVLFEDASGTTTLGAAKGTDRADYTGYTCTSVSTADKIESVYTVDASGELAGYVISDEEDETVWWGVTIPGMIVDYDEITKNEYVQVKIEMINAASGVGLCEDCKVVCECVVDVFRVCEGTASSSNEIYFPYVLYNVDNWFSGIAVSNISTTVDPADMEIEFTFIDSEGASHNGSMKAIDVQVYANSMEGIASSLGWTTVADGAGVLYVTTNFSADGYQFNASSSEYGMFGAGVLPRQVTSSSN